MKVILAALFLLGGAALILMSYIGGESAAEKARLCSDKRNLELVRLQDRLLDTSNRLDEVTRTSFATRLTQIQNETYEFVEKTKRRRRQFWYTGITLAALGTAMAAWEAATKRQRQLADAVFVSTETPESVASVEKEE